jgi:RNA polymerase sigma-70 factor (ECF subfamily)
MGRSREPTADSGVYRVGARDAEPGAGELLEAIRRGDAEAFERVARDCSPRLFRLALQLTGRHEDAEDLVQETLVRALPALRGFEGRAALLTYLTRALTNLWKNRLRSRSRSRSPIMAWLRPSGRPPSDSGPRPEPPDGAPTALDRLEAADRAVRVRAAVARMDPDRRLALLLRELEGMSYEEIAGITRVPVGTVRSRLARAREELRELLGGVP